MAFTTHGHQIPASPIEGNPVKVANCGGPGECIVCSEQSNNWLEGRSVLPEIARDIAYRHIKGTLEKTDNHVTFHPADVYVVWFSKTLQHWKALVSTILPDGRYYELTHNGDKNETYIDTYVKIDNVCIAG